MLNREIVIIKHLRKLGAQESIEFGYSHSRCCHHRGSRDLQGGLLSNLREITVPAEPPAESGRPGHAVFDQRLAPVVPFLNQRLAN